MKIIFVFSLFLFAKVSWAVDLDSVSICLKNEYIKLSNRRAIVAAALNENDQQILTFGTATENQIFEIGSITKTFTANLLAQAVLNGKFNLTDPIPSEYQKPPDVVTYQHLTTHTSGIIVGLFPDFKVSNPLAPFEGLDISLFKSLYFQTPLITKPSAAFAYSNIGVSLLGLILSELNGTSYDELVVNQIFKPLGLTETYFEIPMSEKFRFPEGQMLDPDGQTQAAPHWDLYNTAIDPAGGIRSTIGDMIKYARANLLPEKTALAQSITLSHQPLYEINSGLSIGMNWILEPKKDLIWHNGATYGFNSILVVSKQRRLAVIAMSDTTVWKIDGNGEPDMDAALQDVAFKCIAQ